MASPTLFRRLVRAQAIGSLALLLVFMATFYVERNRTVARLTAQRWAPALRAAAGLGAGVPDTPPAAAVRVSERRPPGAFASSRWAPRIVMLRSTLQASGVAAGDVVFTDDDARVTTWIAVASPGGGVRWLGFQDELVQSSVLARLVLVMVLGFAVVSGASWLLARRLTRPLERLRRRIESHGDGAALPPDEPVTGGGTLEIAAIDTAWQALAARLAHQESERALLLAGVSHDLRSPLSRIRMAAELLPEWPDVATRRASIVRNVDVADRLIASFLDYVRASELPLAADVDLVALARQLLQARDDAPDVLSLAAPERLAVPRANELLLERLLANLVDNAIRHGRPPVRIRLAVEGDTAVVDVEDHGPGIAPAAQARLTQAFARGDASRGTPGTGLGLAIVRQIARRMDGTLSFERADGVARVRVRLPAR